MRQRGGLDIVFARDVLRLQNTSEQLVDSIHPMGMFNLFFLCLSTNLLAAGVILVLCNGSDKEQEATAIFEARDWVLMDEVIGYSSKNYVGFGVQGHLSNPRSARILIFRNAHQANKRVHCSPNLYQLPGMTRKANRSNVFALSQMKSSKAWKVCLHFCFRTRPVFFVCTVHARFITQFLCTFVNLFFV